MNAATLTASSRRVMTLSSVAVGIAEPEREFLAVREHEHTEEAHLVAIARRETLHGVLRARFERARSRTRQPAAAQRAGVGRLEHPLGDLAVGARHVEMEHGVRVDELHLLERARNLH